MTNAKFAHDRKTHIILFINIKLLRTLYYTNLAWSTRDGSKHEFCLLQTTKVQTMSWIVNSVLET
jgi:hypothetical protein